MVLCLVNSEPTDAPGAGMMFRSRSFLRICVDATASCAHDGVQLAYDLTYMCWLVTTQLSEAGVGLADRRMPQEC